jgi:multidrug efflux pump subunit AcrB
MQEITGALIGIGLVLTAVFLPMAFFGGSTGVIYRQFSVTIVAAMSLSIWWPWCCRPPVRHPVKPWR